ncbi:hypothetical protein [Plantactinospora sp. B5E13]|uniref:hypothetical protein n=1 Tax=unclassified Plantactinospora TaxID=2631981 RepID=UPI00325C5E2A
MSASRDTPAARRRTGGVPLAVLLTLVGCVATAACGVPPELERSRAATPAAPTPTPTVTGTPGVGPTLPPTPTVTPTGNGTIAVDCGGRPSRDQVVALLRRVDLLPRSARVTFRNAPVCAADWQYSVIEVPGRDLLQVVTTGPADNLKLVTAGNDVCNIKVRVEAPPGIRTLACA